MPRLLPASAALLLLLAPACTRTSSRGGGAVGVTTIAGMLSDPARNLVYVGDVSSGRVVALSAASGNSVRDVALGNTIGGLALDHCYRQLYVSITGGLRIDALDCDTLQRTAILRLGTTAFALAAGSEGHLLAVTGRGLLDLDLAKLTTTTIKPGVDKDAFLCSDRAATHAWLAETIQGETALTVVDLAALTAPPITTPPGLLPGKAVALAVAPAGDRLYVATDGADGVVILDALTLAKLGTIDVGPGLVGMTMNPTGTRMHVARGDALVQSFNLDNFAPGRDVIAGADVAERGLHLGPNCLSLFVTGSDDSVTSYATFDVQIDAPTAARQLQTYTLSLQGTPHSPWYLFVSLAPGYLYLDPKTLPDPRFFDLSLPDGFALLEYGHFDGLGHSQLTGEIPDDFPTEVTFVIQAAELPKPGKANIEISNPLFVRFLGPECN